MYSQELFVNMECLVEDPDLGLRARLSRIGQIAVVGSYDLGLINPSNHEPDVDVNLLVDSIHELVPLAASIGMDLVSDPCLPWHKFEVYDNRVAEGPAMPKSVYLGAKAYVPGGKIAADVWLFGNKEQFQHANRNHASIKEALTDETAATIIAIKEAAQESNLHLPGFALYRAVLEHGVRSLEEYLNLAPAARALLTAYKVS